MSHHWKPDEWREMDGRAVLECLAEYDQRICVEGEEWIRLIPDRVLADALCDVDIYPFSISICYEAARRIAGGVR